METTKTSKGVTDYDMLKERLIAAEAVLQTQSFELRLNPGLAPVNQ